MKFSLVCRETRLCFLEVLRKLESNPSCQGLSLESFLFLPMQHIARLPLLLDNIFRWLTPESPTYCTCKLALEAVHKVSIFITGNYFCIRDYGKYILYGTYIYTFFIKKELLSND